MRKIFQWVLMAGSLVGATAYAQDLDAQVQKVLADHYNQYKDAEYFSGAELSIYIPNQGIKNYYVGRVAQDVKSKPVSKETLFQIGSITKSFTSAIILQLEKEGKLKLTDSMKTWLPQYKPWSGVTITQLLNMTSGLPNYTESPLLNTQIYYNLSRVWTDLELIDFASPPAPFTPPLKSGYFYSNTNYILASLIIEKVSHNTFAQELTARTIQMAGLNNTFYVLSNPSSALQTRMAHGYSYNQYDNPATVGKDIFEGNLSWAAAAGGIVANTEDVIKWVKALLVDNKILDKTQQNKLMTLVSTKDGAPLVQTTAENAHGFGLGVAQALEEKTGRYWYYEGETMGFRTLYMYKPCNGVIIAVAFNSATNQENDHSGHLVEQTYQLLLQQFPQLNCQDTQARAE